MKKKINIKSKKTLFFALPALFLLSFGVSLAVSHDHANISNDFKLAGYHTIFTETFDAPQNWLTCETIDKTITVTNDADSSDAVAVRVKLEEQWIAADGVTELPLVSAISGLTMAQINFTQNSGWTKQGSYYYYDSDLAKGATTTSLISGVTLSCDANLDTTASTTTSDGIYSNATYRLKITAQTIEPAGKESWDSTITGMIKKMANPDTNIDFTQPATIATGNGNGVNKYIEKGQDVYYFRGEVYNNNVIWANKCWKIVRTTYTGGTKMIYNGVPSDAVVDGETVKQCLATGEDSLITVSTDILNQINQNTFQFNNNHTSPADVGYMYGTRLSNKSLSDDSTSFTFSNDVSRNGSTYTLDTSTGQSISGTWVDERLKAAVRYHYFCTDGATSCDDTKIGYILNFSNISSIDYLNIGSHDYDDIEAAKTAMFTNTNSSNAKTMIETWFKQQNLNGFIAGTRNYEDDLEDAIFCNDRSYAYGSLKGKDSDATPSGNTEHNHHGAYGRNAVKNASNNFDPSLDCVNKNDSFTKTDTINGNAKLNHKIGLATTDELTLAGSNVFYDNSKAYLYTGQDVWSASPGGFGFGFANGYGWNSSLFYYDIDYNFGLRPLVSLKSGTEFASGTGLKTDPFIVE